MSTWPEPGDYVAIRTSHRTAGNHFDARGVVTGIYAGSNYGVIVTKGRSTQWLKGEIYSIHITDLLGGEAVDRMAAPADKADGPFHYLYNDLYNDLGRLVHDIDNNTLPGSETFTEIRRRLVGCLHNAADRPYPDEPEAPLVLRIKAGCFEAACRYVADLLPSLALSGSGVLLIPEEATQ